MKELIIAPSILSADFADMSAALSAIQQSRAQWLHLDVMDGHFVPNLTFGPKMIKDLRGRSDLFFDTHLMVGNPEGLLDEYITAGSDAITFHLETVVHAHRLVERIKATGVKVGISIVPSTPVAALLELLPMLDLVLVMTVNPGYGGQGLIASCLNKVIDLAARRQAASLDFLISVDGGMNGQTVGPAIQAGADVVVMGSAFFSAIDKPALVQTVKALRT